MTPITRAVKRETNAFYRGRPLVIELGQFGLIIREKGRRSGYSVPFAAIYATGAKIAERERRAEKAAKKKGAPR